MGISSIIVMIGALGVVWGGLVAAIIHLRRNPDDSIGQDS